jgi:hypothetical protein
VLLVTSHIRRVHSWSPGSFYEACFQFCRQFYGWRLPEFTSPSNSNRDAWWFNHAPVGSKCPVSLTLCWPNTQQSMHLSTNGDFGWSPYQGLNPRHPKSWVDGGCLFVLTSWYEHDRNRPKVRNVGLPERQLLHPSTAEAFLPLEMIESQSWVHDIIRGISQWLKIFPFPILIFLFFPRKSS